MLALLLAGCGHPAPVVSATGIPAPLRSDSPPLTADQVWTPERSGPPAADTVVAFARRDGRTIVLRQAGPDNAIFALVEIPADTAAAPGDTLRIEAHPVPGRYAVVLQSSAKLGAGARVSFSYAMHLVLPAGAAQTYQAPGLFDQMLSAAHQTGDGKIQVLATERPGSDLIRCPLTLPGTYLLVAPK